MRVDVSQIAFTTGGEMKAVKIIAADPPVPVEILERAIVDLAAGMKRMTASRLKQEALVALLHDHSKVGKPQIRCVLNCLTELERIFLKPKVT